MYAGMSEIHGSCDLRLKTNAEYSHGPAPRACVPTGAVIVAVDLVCISPQVHVKFAHHMLDPLQTPFPLGGLSVNFLFTHSPFQCLPHKHKHKHTHTQHTHKSSRVYRYQQILKCTLPLALHSSLTKSTNW